jgi:hypothetical protein
LKGTLSFEGIRKLKEEREREKKEVTKLAKDGQTKQNYLGKRHYFGKWDNLLDKARFGPAGLHCQSCAENERCKTGSQAGITPAVAGFQKPLTAFSPA